MAEDLENKDAWSGSECSQDPDASESLAEFYSEHDSMESPHHLDTDLETQEQQDKESGEEPLEYAESDKDVSYHEEDDACQSDSRESITDSPLMQTSLASLSSHPDSLESVSIVNHESRPQDLQSSPCSLGYTADLTLALTLTGEPPQGASNRQDLGTGDRRAESSEEGGRSEAPPASVFFGISNECAEPAETWYSESDTDPYRRDRHRTRNTWLSHNESQSEKYVKETKSKCKRIARLLTNAPNPQNKGALLFKKRQQRVKKYTLVSYGTSDNTIDDEENIEEESEQVRSSGYTFASASDSEAEEHYSLYHQQRRLSLNWERLQEMDAETKGKGVFMFAQQRKRISEIESMQEDMRKQGLSFEAKYTEGENIKDTNEMYVHADQKDYMDVKRFTEYERNIQEMNHASNTSKGLVPNRTAKPFMGFQDSVTAPSMSSATSPITKKHGLKFKVPVPIISHPQVWSPTGDIIASRDERISVPAIRTGILPESKRKTTNKQTNLARDGNINLQNKGERCSYVEPEEDCFSLGAEACNFMQPRKVKLKNPPPVAPKPTINPASPPWMMRTPPCEPYIPPKSPVPQPSHSPGGPPSQRHLQPQDWAQPPQTANPQAQHQTASNCWASVNSSSQLHHQQTANRGSQQSLRSAVSMQASSPSHIPQYPTSLSRNWSESTPNSIVSCPPGPVVVQPSTKVSEVVSKSRFADGSDNCARKSSSLAGKGAQLFAKRQSRMQKFVVDGESARVSANRSPSPTSSLPNSWRYSPNVRAPPPLSYNPLLAPFYPPSAGKQPPSTSPKIKPKTKQTPAPATKQLNTLDIMKHQPYYLDSSLFKYSETPEAKSPSPKPSPRSKFEVTKNLKQRSTSLRSTRDTSDHANQSKEPVSSLRSLTQNTSSGEPLAPDKPIVAKLDATPAASDLRNKQPSFSDSIVSAFSPASLIARGVRQMAPRPKFSAKKPVGFNQSRSLSLPRRLNSMPSAEPQRPVIASTQRQTSCQEKVFKPLTPWEAASKSPLGSVDEAFMFQSLPSSVVSHVKAAGHLRSLPEPPDEWKRRVSLDPPSVSKGQHHHTAPAFQQQSLSRAPPPEKPAFCGPPFRPAQPLKPASRTSIGFMTPGPRSTKFSPGYGSYSRC